MIGKQLFFSIFYFLNKSLFIYEMAENTDKFWGNILIWLILSNQQSKSKQYSS